MNEQLKVVVGGIRVVYALIGVVTTLAAVATDQTVAVLNTIGIAGGVSLILGGAVWYGFESDGTESAKIARVKYTFIAMLVSGVVGSLFQFFGEPMAEAEKAPNILTALGGMTVLVTAGLVSVGLGHFSKSSSKRKKCPECANEVLFEARKCQFCQHRFDTDES